MRYEIVFVNDGSTDATEFIIRSLMQGDPSIRLINLSRNFGKDAALCAGIEHAARSVDTGAAADVLRRWADAAQR